jgi:hypothetical protein
MLSKTCLIDAADMRRGGEEERRRGGEEEKRMGVDVVRCEFIWSVRYLRVNAATVALSQARSQGR